MAPIRNQDIVNIFIIHLKKIKSYLNAIFQKTKLKSEAQQSLHPSKVFGQEGSQN